MKYFVTLIAIVGFAFCANAQMTNEEYKKIESEIKTLTVKNQNVKELILSLQRERAKLEYQQNIVSFYATDFKYESFKNEAKKGLTEKENRLKSEYGLNETEIEQLKQDAQTALKTGVPTMQLSLKLDKIDAELKEQITPKIKSIETSISSGIKIGEPIAAGIIEMAYSNPKNELAEMITQYQNIDKRQLETIASKQQQFKDMQGEQEKQQNTSIPKEPTKQETIEWLLPRLKQCKTSSNQAPFARHSLSGYDINLTTNMYIKDCVLVWEHYTRFTIPEGEGKVKYGDHRRDEFPFKKDAFSYYMEGVNCIIKIQYGGDFFEGIGDKELVVRMKKAWDRLSELCGDDSDLF